jgi:geranylgeranyl diphosphate synthase type II
MSTASDLREGKRTLMLIHLLAAADRSDRNWLVGYLAQDIGERHPQDAARVFNLMVAYGSIAFASEFASGVARSAEEAMDDAFAHLPDSLARRFVAELVPYMVERAS